MVAIFAALVATLHGTGIHPGMPGSRPAWPGWPGRAGIYAIPSDGLRRIRPDIGRIQTDSDGFKRIHTDSDGIKRIQTDSDGIKFHSITYQELIATLANHFRLDHQEYIRYITERYL